MTARSLNSSDSERSNDQIHVETETKKRKVVDLQTIAIIGTSGRKDDSKKMNNDNYQKMIAEAERIITEEWSLSWDNIELISGGAAYSV